MKQTLIFSIIIPTYNSEQTLQKCLESVLCQSLNDFEILIMDGISTDNTLAVAKSFNDSRIKIFSEKDEGIYDAMNKGIDKSRGEWLYFLGSDDELYDKDILEEVYNTSKSTKRKIIYGNVLIVGDCIWAKNGGVYDGNFNLEKMLRKNICHQAIFYHKLVYSKLGYYNEIYVPCADWDFNLRCFAKYDFLYFDRVIAKFLGGSTSSKIRDDNFHKDKTYNILKYFKWKLYKKEFAPYLSNVRNEKFIYKLFSLYIKLTKK